MAPITKKLCKTALVVALSLISNFSFAQCISNNAASLIFPGQVPQTIPTTTDEYFTFDALAGCQYSFTFCQYGAFYTADPFLTITDQNNNAIVLNDDWCSLGSNLQWVCPTTGTYRLHHHNFTCSGPLENRILAYYSTCNSGQGSNLDSFHLYTMASCDGPTFTITVDNYNTGMSVHSYFGDGTDVSTTLQPGYNIGYASVPHSYAASGTYSVKHVLYHGTNAVDSMVISFDHHFCSTMSVQLYYDGNSNCLYDIGTDLPIYNPVTVEVDSMNVAIDTISCTSGFTYTAYGAPGDVYEFKLIEAPGDMVASCPVTGIVSDTIVGGVNATRYIGLACPTYNSFDYSIYTGIPVTAANQQFGNIYVTNPHCYGPNATLTMYHSPKYQYNTASPAPASYGGNSITWNLGSINGTVPGPANIFFKLTPSNGPLTVGDTVHNHISIAPTTGDGNPTDNIIIKEDTVVGPWDPNAMYVRPEGCVLAGTNLEYTITFENVGNAPAQNIYVLDTLPAGVIPSTIAVKFASHNMYVQEIHTDSLEILRFDFPNIMLPDSSDHAGCHGSLIYTINSDGALPIGANISQRASIYFDYNDPVMTNYASTDICIPNSVQQTIKAGTLKLYPNPVSSVLTLVTNATDYSVIDNLGRELLYGTTTKGRTQLDVSALAPGLYFLRSGDEVVKFVKE